MKRDMDLVREILLQVEAIPAKGQHMIQFDTQSEEGAVRLAHFRLLIEAGLISAGSMINGGVRGERGLMRPELTWPGHDFLDSIRNDTVWNRTKQKLAEVGGTASIEVVAQVATGFVKAMLNLP